MSKCHICKQEVLGQDQGNHVVWLTYDCECGHYWSELNGEAVETQRERYIKMINDNGFYESFADRKGRQ